MTSSAVDGPCWPGGLFGVASALCALAPSATFVIAFRAVQGLGAALIFPVPVSVLTNAFPAVRASHAIGLTYGIAGLGTAVGPLIGGLLTETVGWRWIFWLNVPLTLASLAIGAWSITESSDETVQRRIDIAGLASVTFGIGLFTLTFDRAPHWGWLSAWTVLTFAGSFAALAVVRGLDPLMADLAFLGPSDAAALGGALSGR